MATEDRTTTRRAALAQLAVLAGAALWPRAAHAHDSLADARGNGGVRAPAPTAAHTALPPITVYKSRSCGCCKNWVQHMVAAGFTVNAVDSEDVGAVKAQMGIREQYQSCHTGLIGRYVIEGHVPADLVKRLVAEKPDALGLAVPGMPVGSPGMEQGPAEKYDVLLLTRTGKASVYAKR
ncbi:MAG: DUF411 domain-containing protein [Gemmatimonadetes bacterium]|nr:DUF411 domain-containing protein [Gemmatimonadota bacterium]